MKNLRIQIYKLLNLELGRWSVYLDSSLLSLILLNCIAIILESVPSYRVAYKQEFANFEFLSVVVFGTEFLLRLFSITSSKEYEHPVGGRIRWLFSPGALIDLFAILPFFLSFLAVDLRFIRIFRLLRILRLLKVARYLNAMEMITAVVRRRREHLIIAIMLVSFMLVISSTIIYYIENPTQPERFSSIPESMWWGVATLTTIGYGDMYPITPIGKVLGAIISILGIGLFALPTGILTSGFAEELSRREKKSDEEDRCIHCGKHPHR